MSEASDRGRGRLPDDWTTARIAGALALAVGVVALVVGATLIGRPDQAHPDAGGRISAFYEDGDVEGLLAAFPAGTVPADQRESAEATLSRILSPGVGVAEVSPPTDVAGTPVVRVVTGDGRHWCVRPDGGVLPGCRVGSIEVDTTTDAPIETVMAEVALLLDRPTQLDLGLASRDGQPRTLTGLQLQAADGGELRAELVQAVSVTAMQATPVDPSAPQLEPGATLYLTWLLDETPSGRELELAWDGGEITLEMAGARWLVR